MKKYKAMAITHMCVASSMVKLTNPQTDPNTDLEVSGSAGLSLFNAQSTVLDTGYALRNGSHNLSPVDRGAKLAVKQGWKLWGTFTSKNELSDLHVLVCLIYLS